MNIESTFDPDEFQRAGRQVVDSLSTHLRACIERSDPVLSVRNPEELLKRYDEPFPDRPPADDTLLERLVGDLLKHSNHLHHPGYIGHQVSVPIPAATLVEMTNALLNNGMAVFEMGQLQSVMERRVVEFLANALGFKDTSGGVLTHGGSVGNFTALLAARQATSSHDVWAEGQQEPLAVLVSDQAHYCVQRAVQAMGWGSSGACCVASDDRFRMDMEDLPKALDRAEAQGRRVVAVVASACSTATGSFDPLGPIADFCANHGLWLHVDGAHGASLALSERHRERLAGIERADSVVWDLHKMMGLPALNTAVLFREQRHAYEAFAQQAGYLFDENPDDAPWFDIGLRTMECTKRAMGATAFCMLRTLGTKWFGEHVDALLERAVWLRDLLSEAADFEIACEPEANILCFRHLPTRKLSADQLNSHQEGLRRAIVGRGSFYLVQAQIRGSIWLRTTLMNPLTTYQDLVDLVAELRRLGSE